MTHALVLIGVLGLTACAPTMQSTQPDPEPVETADAPIDIPPDVALSGELLSKLMLAELSLFRNDIHTTIEILEEVAFETRDPRIAARASSYAIESRRLDVAANTTDLWVELSEDNSEAWYSRAIVRVLTGAHDEAVSDFGRSLDLAQDVNATTSRIAVAVAGIAEPKVGFDLFDQLMAIYPDNQTGQLLLVNLAVSAQLGIERIDEILDRAEAIVEDQDLMADARFKAYQFTGRVDEAVDFAKRYLTGDSDSEILRESYARHLADGGYYREAVGQFELIDNAEALLELGTLHKRANYLDLAYSLFVDYLTQRPEDQFVLLELAEISLTQMRYEDAKGWINRIRSSRFQFHRTSLAAQYIARTEGVEQAIELLAQYRPRGDRERIQLILSTSDIYQQAGRLAESKMTLDNGLRDFPDNSTLLLARSYTAAEMDLVGLVESDTRAVLANDPNNYHALNALGYVLADQTERFEEALELIEAALELKPNDPYILDSMGWVQFKLGNTEAAIEFLESALENRDDPIISAHLGEVYWVLGNEQRARRIWNRALKKSPDEKYLIETVERFVN